MELLPDDVLLAVFRLLDVPGLLRVGCVCRRWRRLARQPQLWKRVDVHDLDADRKMFEAVLRWAPCVAYMFLGLDQYQPLLETTSCAARRLSLSVWDDRAALACRVVRRQLDLGGLQELRVHLHGNAGSFAELMGAVSSSSGLLKLILQNYSPSVGGVVPPVAPYASLVELHSDTPRKDPHLQVHLFSHRSTLEVLSLPACIAIPIHLVCNLSRLRSLECPPQKDMQLLLACGQLRSVAIRMECSSKVREREVPRVQMAIKGTVEFLSQAAKLEKFLLFPNNTVLGMDLVKQLTIAPTMLGSSGLRDVELGVLYEMNTERDMYTATPQDCFAQNLPLMPHLRRIVLGCLANTRLLKAISPDTVPELAELHVVSEMCVHSYIHKLEVKEFLEKNLNVHLLLRDNSQRHEDQCDCDACRLGCHMKFSDPERGPNFGVYSHSEHERCAATIHRKDQRTWIRL